MTAAKACHASFTPFVVTLDGTLGHEAVLFLHCLVELSTGWERSHGLD